LDQPMALTLTLVAVLELVITPEILGCILEAYHRDPVWFLMMMVHQACLHLVRVID